tara:strand:+ start:57395 stop:58801 length:1407 start_codon:yes stop_codon:yes gene_type:complete
MITKHELVAQADAIVTRIKSLAAWRPTAKAPDTTIDKDVPRVSLATRPWQLAGWGVIAVFFIGGLTWAGLARIDGAAIAAGTVGVESNRKSIAHLEGGIVKAILVAEGERVQAGQPLIEMDNTRALATLDLLKGRRNTLIATDARLKAERHNLSSIEFPAELLDRADRPKVLDLMDGEMQVLDTRRQNLDRQDRILKERIAQQNAEIRGLRARRGALGKRRTLLKDEFEMMSGLLKDGLVARNRVLSVERKLVDTEGDIQGLAAKIAKAGDEIAKLEMERVLSGERRQEEVAQQQQDVKKQLAEVDERVRAAQDILDRTIVTAPENGVVTALKQHTPGGVVQAGEAILDLVPDGDRYVIDLRINPNDIDTVYPGQPARVRLTALNARSTSPIMGAVSQISADRLIDPATGAGYFSGRVIPTDGTFGPGGPEVVAGMQAEVFLVTAERSVLDYLLAPLTRSLNRAGREL